MALPWFMHLEKLRNIRLRRLPFLAWGLALFSVKLPLDALLFRIFHQPYSPLIYLDSARSPLLHPGDQKDLWLAMWGLALPFIAAGVFLTLARLRDAHLPTWMVVFFFVPLGNLLFFAMLPLVPSRAPSGAPALAPSNRDLAPVGRGTALLVSSVTGAFLLIGTLAISVGMLKAYGAGLFVGAPFVMGYGVVALLFHLDPDAKLGRGVLAAALAAVLSLLPLVLMATEGLVCILMALPLMLILVLLGAFLAWVFIPRPRWRLSGTASAFVLLPLLMLRDALLPEKPLLRCVRSEVIVDAQPATVWKRVIAFPELPPPTELIFRAGVACPLRASISGTGAGAVRRCEFSTGTFVEPIKVWDPEHELSFEVASQPDALREWTLWAGPRPPHLDGYLQSRRGQFLLEALPDGRTRLTGRTWYELRMGPEPYWALWADPLIHTIHFRVLKHVKRLAEADRG